MLGFMTASSLSPMDDVPAERESVLGFAPKLEHRREILESVPSRETFAFVIFEPLAGDTDHASWSDHDLLDLHTRNAHQQPRAPLAQSNVQMERVAGLVGKRADRTDRVSLLSRENERHESFLESVEPHHRPAA